MSTYSKILIGISFAIYFTLFFVSHIAQAEQRELAGNGADKIDAVLLLDASGSMLQTDPEKLRVDGAKLFTKFLGDDDRLGIVQFEKSASILRALTPFKADDPTVMSDIAKVGSSGLYTDIFSGIESASKVLLEGGRSDATKAIVLLSDGRMEPDPAVAGPYVRTEELLERLLPELKAQGIRIHTLALSEKSDRALLSEIAVATEGVTWFASDAESIHQAFAQLFLAVKQPQVVPLVGKAFSIDVDVQEATFYINRNEGAPLVLVSPSGKIIKDGEIPPEITDSVKWFSSHKFDVVTINAPESGDWQVQGVTDTDGFATVLTNLKLVSDWPSSIISDEPVVLQARLNDGNKPVVLKEIGGVTKYGIQIIPTDRVSEPVLEELLRDDGTAGDAIAGDGIFSYRVTLSEPGEYRAWIVAKGPTFDRRQQLPFQVKPPPVSLSVTRAEVHDEHGAEGAHGEPAPDDTHDRAGEHGHAGGGEHDAVVEHGAHGDADSGSGEQIIKASLSAEAKLLKTPQVKLALVTSDRKRLSFDMQRNEEGDFELPVSKFPITGEFTLTATLKGITKKKGEFEAVSKPIKFTLKEMVKEKESVVDVVIEKKVEEKPVNPIPFSIVTFLLALAGCGYFVWQARSIQAGESFTLPELPSLEPALAGIAMLESRVAMSQISLDDPVLKNDVILPSLSRGHSSEEMAEHAAESTESHESGAEDNSVDEVPAEEDVPNSNEDLAPEGDDVKEEEGQ